MRKKALAVMICILVSLSAPLAWAGSRGAIIEEIRSQQHRINQGVRSGELTRRETQVLDDNLIRIERHFHRASRDGWIDPGEEARLWQELEMNSEKIRRLKHNDRVRY